MVAATTVKPQPTYFPDFLELPLSLDYHHKSWHTTRECPQLLAVKIDIKPAMFIAQLHYWLQQEDVGIYKEGWHWIYNTEWEWLEQFPCFKTEGTVGRVRRQCEQIGYVVSNNFNQNPLNRTKYSTLDYYLIALETGWNPLQLDLNREYARPPGFKKGEHLRGRHKSDHLPLVYFNPEQVHNPEFILEELESSQNNHSANLQDGFCNNSSLHPANLQDHLYTYSSFISTKSEQSNKKRKEKNYQKGKQTSQNVKDVKQNRHQTLPLKHTEQTKTKIPPSAQVEQKINKMADSTKQEYSPIPTREPYDWEIAWNGTQYEISPDFVRWRAKTHYEPQGGQWASGARSHAAAEIARKTRENPGAVAWMWQDFLEYAEKSADNALAHVDAGMEPDLPQAFTEESRNTDAVGAKLSKAKESVESVKIALLEAAKQAALPPAEKTEAEKFWQKTREVLERCQIFWRNFRGKPVLKKALLSVIETVQDTPGLIMTEEGPALDPDYTFVSATETDDLTEDDNLATNGEDTRSDHNPDDEPDNDPPGGSPRPTPPTAPNEPGGGACTHDDNSDNSIHSDPSQSAICAASGNSATTSQSMSGIVEVLDTIVPSELRTEEYEIVYVEELADDPWSEESEELVEPSGAIATSDSPATTVTTESQTTDPPEPTIKAPPEIKVGDSVYWDNCPGYLEQFAPFEVMELTSDANAHKDLIEKPVPLTQLRKADQITDP